MGSVVCFSGVRCLVWLACGGFGLFFLFCVKVFLPRLGWGGFCFATLCVWFHRCCRFCCWGDFLVGWEMRGGKGGAVLAVFFLMCCLLVGC